MWCDWNNFFMKRLKSNKYNDELNDAVAIAYLAGNIMLHYYNVNYSVSFKDEIDISSAIYTEVDVFIDKLINCYFSKLWPNDSILTEETNPEKEWFKSKRIWIVDPLDGTTGFKFKTGSFGVSIALIEDGVPVVGVIYAPIKNIIAHAVINEGAFLNGKKINIENNNVLKSILCSSNHINKKPYQDFLKKINSENKLKIIKTESCVVKVLYLLKGKGEIYPILPKSNETSVPKFWDIAASDIILHEAGAILTDFEGERYKYNKSNYLCEKGVLIGTKEIHKNILNIIKLYD